MVWLVYLDGNGDSFQAKQILGLDRHPSCIHQLDSTEGEPDRVSDRLSQTSGLQAHVPTPPVQVHCKLRLAPMHFTFYDICELNPEPAFRDSALKAGKSFSCRNDLPLGFGSPATRQVRTRSSVSRTVTTPSGCSRKYGALDVTIGVPARGRSWIVGTLEYSCRLTWRGGGTAGNKDKLNGFT